MSYKRSRAAYEENLEAQQASYVSDVISIPPTDANTRDDQSHVPIWKQEVTDERGRKRLHGAFTGGFSAGYFNTVGSKEGWTPSTFKSSKRERKKDAVPNPSRPMDFMDEEDLADAEDDREASTNDSFSALGSTEKDVSRRAAGLDLLEPSENTVGLKMLRKMGWRDGQGLGPQVRRHTRLDDEHAQESALGEAHLYARKDSPMDPFPRKEEFKGYEEEARLNSNALSKTDRSLVEEDSDRDDMLPAALLKPKKKPVVRKGGFGIGVLNDSSDEDPYSMGPKISYNKTLGGDKKKKKKGESTVSMRNANPLLRNKPVFMSRKIGTSKAELHDGHLTLDGSAVASSMPDPTQETKSPPPVAQEAWESSKMSSQPQANHSSYQSTADPAQASTIDPPKSAAQSGEASLPARSVFDFLKPDARNRIVGLTKNETLPAAGSESGNVPAADIESLMPTLDPQIAATALGRGVAGFVPYADNPAKLTRYRGFLSYRANVTTEPPKRPPSMRQGDWIKELHEFTHAATIFKPMTSVMASRFTSSVSSKSTHPENSAESPGGQELLSHPKSKPADPAEEAAQIGMFGPLTRSSTFFYPSRLLCKRFNVPVPAHVTAETEAPSSHSARSQPASSASRPPDNPLPSFGSRFQSSGFQTGSGRNVELLSKDTMDVLRREAGVEEVKGEMKEEETKVEETKVKEEAKEMEKERNEAQEVERPGDAVFKAIFGSDSEDD